MPVVRSRSGGERWSGTDPNLKQIVPRLLTKIDAHFDTFNPRPWDIHAVREGRPDAFEALEQLAGECGVAGTAESALRALLAGDRAGDAEQSRRQLSQVLQLLETVAPPDAASVATHRVGSEDVRALVRAIRASYNAGAAGAEVMAITGAHAILNIMKCGTSDPAVQKELVEAAGDEGALDLATQWLAKHSNIDVAVAACCWLVAFLSQSEKNLDRLMLVSSDDDEKRSQQTAKVLDAFTGSIEKHPESEQVVEGAVLALLALSEHEAGAKAVAENIGLEWCVQGLEWHAQNQSSSMGMKDAFGRLAYRIVQLQEVKTTKAFVDRDGLHRLVRVCMSNNAPPTAEKQGYPPENESRAAMATAGGRYIEPRQLQRCTRVDFELPVAVTVVLVDTVLSENAEQNLYIYEVFQGNQRIWHLRKTFLEFSVLDKLLRPAAQRAGVHLPELPSRWTLGKNEATVRDERAPRLKQYLQVAVCSAAIKDETALSEFFAGTEAPIRPDGAESYQLGLAATMLLILHFPPTHKILGADGEEWLPALVGNMLTTMSQNVGSVLVQMTWTAALGVVASYTSGKHVVRKLQAADEILQAMRVHDGCEAMLEVGCFSLCVATRGLRAEDGHIVYGERGMAAALAALQRFPMHIDVCTAACAAVWAFAFKNNDVRDWAAQHALFETLVEVLKNHPGEVKLLSHACVAIGNLAANHRVNQNRIGAVGGIEAIVEELRLHIAASAVCYTASSALSSALDKHEENSKRFQQCGGIALFEDIVVEHGDPKINRTVKEMMSGLIVDEIDLRPKCTFDEILEPPTTQEGLLGFVAKKLSGPKRPNKSQRSVLKQWLESSFAFGIMQEDLRSPLIEALCDDAIYLHTIEPEKEVRFRTEAQVPSKTGVLAMMGGMENADEDDCVESVCGWPLLFEHGVCGFRRDEPEAHEQTIRPGSMLLSVSASSATRIRAGANAGKVWVIAEDWWEWTSSELLKKVHGVPRLLKVLSAVPTLSALSPFQLLGLGLQMVEEKFESQTQIFEEGAEDSAGVYVVQTGAVQLSCRSMRVETEKKVAGQAFGLDGPLATCPRCMTATATDVGATVLRMSKAAAADGLNFYRDVNNPQGNEGKLARLLPLHLVGLAVHTLPMAIDDKRAFGAMMRPLGQARARSEFLRAVRSFVTYCGQPITISNILDEPTLEANVNDHQLRVDLDREEAVVVKNVDTSTTIPGSKFVCENDDAAWASEQSGHEGNLALRKLLVEACKANASENSSDTVDEAKLGQLSRLVHSCCDRTNSAGDAFVKLQEIFLTSMISITPADHSDSLSLEIAWDGSSRYIRAISKNVFQITSLDPMSNNAAWFRCKCVSTGLIHIARDVYSPMMPAGASRTGEAGSAAEDAISLARLAQDSRLQKLSDDLQAEMESVPSVASSTEADAQADTEPEPEPEPDVQQVDVHTAGRRTPTENLVDMAGRLIYTAIQEGAAAYKDGYAKECYEGYRAAATQIVKACPPEPTESESLVCKLLERALVTAAAQDQEESSAWTMRDAFDQVIGSGRASQDDLAQVLVVQTSPPVSRAGKIGGDLQIMGMSSAEETESGASAALHLQHLHIFVEFGTGENLQGYIVRTPRSCPLCSGHPRS